MFVKELDLKRSKVVVVPESTDDLYRLSLILERDDLVYAWTLRTLRISDGLTERRGERVKAYIGIRLEKVEFQEFSEKLRVHGVVIEAPDFLHAQGSHHTHIIEPGKEVLIVKKSRFKRYQLKLLEERGRNWALILSVGEDETAISVLRDQGVEVLLTIHRSKGDIKTSIRERYYDYLSEVARKSLEILSRRELGVETLIVASTPLLLKWFREELNRTVLPQVRGKGYTIYEVEVSEGGIAGVYELLRSGKVQKLFRNLRIVFFESLMNEVFQRFSSSPEKVSVGLEEIELAASIGAIDKLIVVDNFLREHLSEELIIRIFEAVDRSRGEIIIVPLKSEAGLKLRALGGIVALLRYPLKYS